MTKIVERNIAALVQRKEEEIKKRSFQERIIDSVTAFMSSMASVLIHAVIYGCWTAWNLNWFNLKAFDPDFVMMGTFAAVEAIFLTTFVLIGQKRLKSQADKWSEFDLQMNLLTEHEVTRIMNLVIAMAKKMDIKEANDEEIDELSKDISPEKVLDTMEKAAL